MSDFFKLFGLECHIFFISCCLAVQTQARQRAGWPGPIELPFFCYLPGVKNELFNSKQAFSWPLVRFDLGIRSLHECLYCRAMFPQCVNYWKNGEKKSAAPRFIWQSLHCWTGGPGAANPQMLFICPERVTWPGSAGPGPRLNAALGSAFNKRRQIARPPLPSPPLSSEPNNKTCCVGVAARPQVSQISS